LKVERMKEKGARPRAHGNDAGGWRPFRIGLLSSDFWYKDDDITHQLIQQINGRGPLNKPD
jgi:hypothetical protein